MIKKITFISVVTLASLGVMALELSQATASTTCPLEGTPACPKLNCPLKDTPQCPYDQASMPACCKANNESQALSLYN
jgi:hypothetical protein